MEEQSYLKNDKPVSNLRETLRHLLMTSASIKYYFVLFQDMVTSKEKKTYLCSADFGKESICKNIKVITEMQKSLFDYFKLPSLTVNEIKLFAEVFLEEYFNSIRSIFPALEDSFPSKEEVKHLSCVVTSDYLEGWLETSTSCKMTVSAFYDCCNTYYLPAEYNRNCTAPPYDKTQIYAAKGNFLNFVGLRQKQENDNMEMETKFFDTKDKGKLFNFIGLEWMISKWQLVLYRRPIARHYLNRKSKRNKSQNMTLYSDYTAFYEYLKVLDDCYKREKDSLKARKFVVGSMLIRKLEQATRAQLSNVFAQAQIHHRDNKNLFGETISNVYWGRYKFSGEESLLFPNACSQKSITLVNEPYDVLSYKKQVDNLFNLDDSKQEQEISKWTALRAAQMDAQLFLRKMFPLDKVHPWNSDTFIDAGEFYNNDYPIVRTFLEDGDRMANSKGSEDFERFYDCIHKVYCTLYNTEATPLCELAKSSYFSSKKQVKRSD